MDALIASAVIATSLALVDAGIEMFDLVSACSAGFLDEEVILDCDASEQEACQGSLFIAYMPNLNQISHIVQSGGSLESIDLCIDACVSIAAVMKKSLI
jgi:exosome complex component MTR3